MFNKTTKLKYNLPFIALLVSLLTFTVTVDRDNPKEVFPSEVEYYFHCKCDSITWIDFCFVRYKLVHYFLW